MIREALDHFQISPNLTDNIMQEVARLKQAAPSGTKPLVPWGDCCFKCYPDCVDAWYKQSIFSPFPETL